MSEIIIEPLTNGETEVLALLAEDLTNKEIANRLYKSVRTIEDYVRRLNSKLDTSNRQEIVERASELGILAVGYPDSVHDKTNLPTQTTPFVGREAELDTLYKLLLNPDIRLLTILAPGGMGKTRLAIEAAEQQLSNFPNGVYFLHLQSIVDPVNIPSQIATSTGYQFQSDGREPNQQILDFLANKQMLLLMDNFEHLLDGVPLLTEILQAAPNVKLLVTSREKLNLSGETVYALAGMQFPSWETPEDALQYDAVQLLVSAAQRVKPDWQVNAENLDYVARVCRLTQGMPLGILLAVSWLDVYSLDRICEEIQQSADILETELRDMPERQRSIRAVFEYSWERLKPAEKEAFMRMSVFRGGCTPKAAEAVTGANPRTLQGLVNKALLLRNREGRFDIHELLRQYAEAQLETSGKADTVHDSHMGYYANALLEQTPHVRGHRQIEALNDIEFDFENARVAWKRAAEQQHYAALNDMIESLAIFGNIRTRHGEIYALFSPVVRSLAEQSQPDARQEKLLAWIAGWYSALAVEMTYHTEAETVARKGLELARKHEDGLATGCCLNALAYAVGPQGRKEDAAAFSVESVAVLRQCDNPYVLSLALFRAGYNVSISNNAEDAIKFTQESLEIARENRIKNLVAQALYNLAAFSTDPEQAKRYATQALALRRELGDRAGVVWSLMDQLDKAIFHMRLDEAKRLLEESISLANEINKPSVMVRIVFGKADWKFIHEDYEAALPLYREALALAERTGHPRLITVGRFWVAVSLVFVGEFDAAISRLVDDAPSFFELAAGAVPEALSFLSLPLVHILHHRGENERCVELLGMTFEDAPTLPLIKQHPYMVRLQDELRSELGADVYDEAWVRGRSLKLREVVQKLLEEFDQEI